MNVTIASVAMASGGSFVSWSVTSEATIVRVQGSLAAKSSCGSRVKVVGPPLTVAGWVPLESHEMSNHEFATSTGSLNVTCTFASSGTSIAPSVGVVVATVGAVSGGTPVTAMSSMPTHSSVPFASVVMTRIWTIGWLFAAGGRVTLTASRAWPGSARPSRRPRTRRADW